MTALVVLAFAVGQVLGVAIVLKLASANAQEPYTTRDSGLIEAARKARRAKRPRSRRGLSKQATGVPGDGIPERR